MHAKQGVSLYHFNDGLILFVQSIGLSWYDNLYFAITPSSIEWIMLLLQWLTNDKETLCHASLKTFWKAISDRSHRILHIQLD